MKTTVKLDLSRSIDIEPAKAKGAVSLKLRLGQVVVGSMELDPDKIGAVLFGIEQAAEAAQIAGTRQVAL